MAGAASPYPARRIDLGAFVADLVAPADTLAELDGLFAGRPLHPSASSSPQPAQRFAVTRHPGQDERFTITHGPETILQLATADQLVPWLEWAITTAAVHQLTQTHLLFHAGAVARSGHGVLLPGHSGAGKSTLVAGLATAGWQVFSDEVAIVAPLSFQMIPFPRRLCVKEGSRAVLAHRYPELDGAQPCFRFTDEPVWYLAPPASASPADPAIVRAIVIPHYAAAATPRLAPVRRSTALESLLGQSFNAYQLGAEGIRSAVAMLRTVATFELEYSTLDQAIDLLSSAGTQ